MKCMIVSVKIHETIGRWAIPYHHDLNIHIRLTAIFQGARHKAAKPNDILSFGKTMFWQASNSVVCVLFSVMYDRLETLHRSGYKFGPLI